MVKSKLLACCFAVPVCLLFFFLEPMVDPDRTGMEWNGMEWNGMIWTEWGVLLPSFLPVFLPSCLPSLLLRSCSCPGVLLCLALSHQAGYKLKRCI